MMENQKLKKMNVPELKDICRIRNITTKGLKKSEILEKIKKYLDEDDGYDWINNSIINYNLNILYIHIYKIINKLL